MISCYITGKGMYATDSTWSFKTHIIKLLESSGLGYDTRYRYYQAQFPEMPSDDLARLICDPMEYYDPDWPAFRDQQPAEVSDELAATEFMLRLDKRFRDEAQVAIGCYDEAGFGSGVNAMIFLTAGKPVLGFYNRNRLGKTLNLSNILQLQLMFPDLFTLQHYETNDEILAMTQSWLTQPVVTKQTNVDKTRG